MDFLEQELKNWKVKVKMTIDELIEEIVYAIFEGEVELDDPEDTIKELKQFLFK